MTPNAFQLACWFVQRVCPDFPCRQHQLVTLEGPPYSLIAMGSRLLKLRGYVTVVSFAAVTLVSLVQWEVPAREIEFWNVFAALIGLGLLAEAFSLQMRHGSATVAVSFVPYLASLLLVGPVWAMAVAGLTELAAETLFRRKPLLKVAHNTAKEILGVGLAGILYVALGGTYSITSFSPAVLPFVLSVVLYFLVSNGATATAFALSSDTEFVESWRELVGKSFVYDVFSSSLSVLLAFLYTELELAGFLLVIIPLFFLRHAHAVNNKLEQANRDLLELMVKSIEARDPYTSGHSVRVARMAKALAKALGLPSKEVEQIETAALLHDVGKIYEEYAPILRKEGKLTPEERMLMQTHPVKSAELVATISTLRGYVERCVRHHHENWDGAGYPHGLAGEEIPIGARIVMIADTTDAMTTDRPYRGALTYDKVVSELERFSAKQFDPELVAVFKGSAAVKRMVEEKAPIPEPVRPEAARRRATLAAR